MKKFNLILLSTIIFSTSLFAKEEVYSFIGIQASATKFDKISAPTIGLSYGEQTKAMRTSISYNYANKSSDTFQSLMMQIDSAILIQTFRDIPFKPYLGASFGLMKHNSDKGYLYGVDTGLSYIFNKSVDFDLGYKFLKTSKMKDLDTIHDLTFTLHYFY